MTIAHHPEEDLLVSYASGAADEAHALIVVTHLAFCAQCRDTVTLMERMGGALLEQVAPAAVRADALNRALDKLKDSPPFERPRREPSRDGTPAALRAYLGRDLRDVRWRSMGPKLSYAPLFRRGDTKVRLLRGVPGADSGNHSHSGVEYTLVLRGGFTDPTGNYGPGDFQVADAGVLHNPIADPGEDCINLAVTTGPLKFENLLQKIVGPFFGF